ncbi:response regulator [Plectonema radiosum]|nr:response regulator [Plectonema radiosum]
MGAAMYLRNEFSTNLFSLQGLRVLVVDNNEDCRVMLSVLLRSYGVEVQTASSVKLGLEIFGQWQPDILVSDIAFPGEDSYALIQQVRTKAERGELVIAIAVTGYDTQNMGQRGLCQGFDLWFSKPLDLDEFVAVLASFATCQRSSYAIAERILSVPTHSEAIASLEKQFNLTFPN